MKAKFIISPFANYFSLAGLKLKINGKSVGRFSVGREHEIDVVADDVLEFSIQFFKAQIKIESDTNLIVYWNVSANSFRAQFEMLFKNCLAVVSVNDEAFENPSQHVYGTHTQQMVSSDKGLAAVGLVLAVGLVYLSISSTNETAWWRDVAMVLGLGGAFRFLTFLFSQNIRPRSGFGAFLLFALVCVFLAVTSSLAFPLKLSLLVIPLVLPFRAYQAYIKKQPGIAV